ncbi:nuclear transport factor 2 family protein [Agarilytica rhodophyticola]|uniref:nuclear transport factor 2 family protein n=1 Tax=Agarilytica rhodophyticola TaxID=1737490 RepID=UPI000B345C79|nr:nuclear transport factor 2 family protein [Agarilytica rhodophyticola]
MKLSDKREIIQVYLNAYNKFDIEGMLNTLADDIEFENIQNNQVNASASGKDEFRALAEQGKTLFSERKQSILAIEETSSITLVKISFYAKVAENLPNGLKAGDELNLTGTSEFIFSNNKISSIRDIS